MEHLSKEVTEGKVLIRTSKDVFYNPHMEFCRDVCSLLLGALPEGGRILDGMCGTGIRGIRYAKENHVDEVVFVDANPNAARLARGNARRNGLDNYVVVRSELNRYFFKGEMFDFVEIDPFGTPVPYLYNAMRVCHDGTVLSVTATDTAVLCGAHSKACLKNYGAKPLKNEYCHETGARILLGYIVRIAAQFNFGVSPLIVLSKRHYFKLIVRLDEGARGAISSIRMLGFVSHCPRCLNRRWKIGLADSLPLKCGCGCRYEHGGPLWLGELHDPAVISRMRRLNKERGYKNSKKIERLLSLISEEIGMPPTYFHIPALCKKAKLPCKKLSLMMGVKDEGYKVSRTHFRENSIKTDAPIKVLYGYLEKRDE